MTLVMIAMLLMAIDNVMMTVYTIVKMLVVIMMHDSICDGKQLMMKDDDRNVYDNDDVVIGSMLGTNDSDSHCLFIAQWRI